MSTENDPEQGTQAKRSIVMLIRLEHLEDPENFLLTKMQLEKTAASMGMGFIMESEEVWMARGRVPDCDCQLLQCVCVEKRQHKEGCQYRLALTCAIPIACEPHNFDVCPTCDPCTCAEKKSSPNI